MPEPYGPAFTLRYSGREPGRPPDRLRPLSRPDRAPWTRGARAASSLLRRAVQGAREAAPWARSPRRRVAGPRSTLARRVDPSPW